MNPQRLYLHKRVAPIAQLASSDESRPNLQGIRVAQLEGGRVQLEVTDGHELARLTLTPAVADGEFPAPESPPPTQSAGLIHRDAWETAFKGLKKSGHHETLPVLDHLEVSLGAEHATLTSTDLEGQNRQTVKLMDGRFPNLEAVLPKEEPTVTISFNATLLKRIMGVLAQISDDKRQPRVKLDVFGPNSPMRFTLQDADLELIGLVMPMRM